MQLPISLYVHWPYCASKCPYCDFFSVIDPPRESEFFTGYERDLNHWKNIIGGRAVKTIFFGGGTPSLMDPKLVDFVIAKIADVFSLSSNCEITLEANPTSLDRKNFKHLKESGVNRLSIGVQSVRDHHLKFLGRGHCAQDALDSIEEAIAFFDRLSIDLIYALPSQTLDEWRQDLERVFSFNLQHISLYQLTIEPQTAFFNQFARGDFSIPDQDLASDFYGLTRDFLLGKGLSAYEISNYCIPGFESRHNLIYWNYEDYIGIGPGAHSRVTLDHEKCSFFYPRNVEKWLLEGSLKKEILSEEDVLKERLMMNLRIKKGIPIKALKGKIDQKKIETLINENIVKVENGFLSLVNSQLHQAVLKFLL